MGNPSDLVADVIRGNLQGAMDNANATQAKIDALQEDLDRFKSEASEYASLLERHESAPEGVLH